MADPLLEVRNLSTQFETKDGTVHAVNDVSFTIEQGETFGFVGESGAGKSVTGKSIIGLIQDPGRITGGEVRFKGRDLQEMSEAELRSVRGNEISMIFQDPMTSLNPSYTIETQITDIIKHHRDVSHESARTRAIELLDRVGIPDAKSRIDDYPHQFSGGMRQRALIAMALSCDPDLVIADEPTTALDVTTQAQILELLDELQREYDLSVHLITHDMGVIAEMCDRIAVMYAGEIVEKGTVDGLFDAPRHPYTLGLLKAIPRIDDQRTKLDPIEGTMPDLIETPSGCSFHPRCPYATEQCETDDPDLEPVEAGPGGRHESACFHVDDIDFEADQRIEVDDTERDRQIGETLIDVQNLKKYFTPESESWVDRLFGNRSYVHAVDDVSLTIKEGETLGLVGESGCGKTTLGRTLTRLYEPDEGKIVYAGTDLTELGRRELRDAGSDLQVIFQNPFSSLNPRMTIKEVIGRPMEIHDIVSSEQEKRDRVVELLETVGLEASHIDRYPHEFSGGQKQRIGIARALAVEPDFIVADEPVSALDASVQASILNTLMDLQEEFGLTYLFIAHDLNVVQHIADRIAVMYLGEIVESGTVEELFDPPHHPYTEILLSSIPQPDPDAARDRILPQGEPPSPIDPPSGCRFHTRCPYAMEECKTNVPDYHDVGDGHDIHCHLFDEELQREKGFTVDEIMTGGELLPSQEEQPDPKPSDTD
jgi:peptide/nickel transport system ATP-binding protein